MEILNSNTIIYCKHWVETVTFYKTLLKLPILFSTDWFVEFGLSDNSRLSIADSRKTTIEDRNGAALTISFEVCDLAREKKYLEESGVYSTAIKKHPWNARVFYVYDPEGNRLEFWQKIS